MTFILVFITFFVKESVQCFVALQLHKGSTSVICCALQRRVNYLTTVQSKTELKQIKLYRHINLTTMWVLERLCLPRGLASISVWVFHENHVVAYFTYLFYYCGWVVPWPQGTPENESLYISKKINSSIRPTETHSNLILFFTSSLVENCALVLGYAVKLIIFN